jgi:CHAT domain-containing protein
VRSLAPSLARALRILPPLVALSCACDRSPESLVVADVSRGYAGDRAGIRPGDRLTRWERTSGYWGEGAVLRSGALRTALDWHRVQIEEAPRGRVRVEGLRGTAPFAVTLPDGEWRVSVEGPPANDPVWDAERRGDALSGEQKIAEAADAYAGALEPGPAAPIGLTRASLLSKRALAVFRQGAHSAAAELLREADLIYEREAQGSAPHRSALLLLAKTERNLGRLEDSAARLERILALSRERDPGGPLEAATLGDLGSLANWRGDIDAAEASYREAARVYGKLGMKDAAVGQVAMGLGNVAWYRGDLAVAETSFSSAKTLFEKTEPGSHLHAWSLQNLGMVALERGHLQLAEDYLRESLAIRETFGSDTLDVALALENLGSVADRAGRYEDSRRLLERALAIHERFAPESIIVARLYTSLGSAAVESGDLDGAEARFEKGLALQEKLGPESELHAYGLFERAELSRRRGRLDEARAMHEHALAIRRRLAPGSWDEALSLHALGLLASESGDDDEALRRFRSAVDAIEIQRSRLGGSLNERALFASSYAALFKDLIAVLVESHRSAEALSVLERYRARGLEAILAMRHLDLESDLPETLRRRRTVLASAYDSAQSRLAELSGRAAPDESERLLAELQRLRQDRMRLDAEVERASPRLAALESDAGLSFDDARLALDPGTLALSYSVHQDESFVFIVDRDGLEVQEISLGAAELSREVEAVRLLLESAAAGDVSLRPLRERASRLYASLVAPAEGAIARHRRLLIVPDGPLHGLPFGALVREAPEESYLVEWRPIHQVVSLSVYAELKRGRRPRQEAGRVVAFGDPAREDFRPLPATREEIAAIAALAPDTTDIYLGPDATERRVKELPRDTRVVHFATHGRVQERFPLDSYLALASGDGDNGKLQAWEIFEQMRIDADLVTLSGCETGLGREIGGEGLLGLTRAFQYAGARTVLASLWSVSDRATATLMVRFYRALDAGQTKDVALQSAEASLIREGFHPGDWAAFQLAGDWR